MTTTTPTELKLAFPDQLLLVTFEDQELDPVALDLLADGFVHRCVPRSFARASADDLSRHVCKILHDRALELGFVDVDAE